ncbi:MAG: ABC transporter ATP-binding protein [Lachnospiraceae bacterium]|nr:ABC transporter ATP-binding protein [Lachnospiraceae bacterium]
MLEIKEVTKTYNSKGISYPVLKGVTATIPDGSFVAVMGPSGSGKTTLLHCLSGFITADSGAVLLDGQDILTGNETTLAEIRQHKLGFVFQDFMLLNGLTIQENIFLPQIIAGKSQQKMEKNTNHLLSMFHIEDIANKYPAEVSGGQKQRASIARALSNNPSIILADEPTGNLDTKSSAAVIGAFLDAKEKIGATIFMVTHDAFAASYADKVIALRDGIVFGELLHQGQPKEFLDELLNFTRKVNGEEYDTQ